MEHIKNQDLANKLNLYDWLSKSKKTKQKNLSSKNQWKLLLKHSSFFDDLQVRIKVHHIDGNVEYQLLIDVWPLVEYHLD
jgi:hypothetical protein